jgi:hypothetical protein
MTAFLPNSVSGKNVRQTGKGLFLLFINIDLDLFPDSQIPRILGLHLGRETRLISFFERLKISYGDVWT